MRPRVVLVGVFLALATLLPSAPAGASNGARDTSDEDVRREAGLDVLALIPGAYDHDCLFRTSFDIQTDPLLGRRSGLVLAFLRCSTNDDEIFLDAITLADDDAVNDLYDAYSPGGLDTNTPGCESDDTWDKGRYKCFATEGGGSAVIWTLDSEYVVFGAFSTNGDIAALEEWWENDAPPLNDPPPPGKPVSDTDWRKNAAVLVKSVPKDLRATCDASPLSERGLEDLYRNILFLRTVVSCDPGQGIDTYYLVDFQSRATAAGYIDAFAPLVDRAGQPSVVESDGGSCPGSGTWSRRSSAKTAGRFICYFTEDGRVVIAWNDKRQGIVLVAVRGDGDAEQLLDFYNSAGPIPNPTLG